jgi:hypothetical protein
MPDAAGIARRRRRLKFRAGALVALAVLTAALLTQDPFSQGRPAGARAGRAVYPSNLYASSDPPEGSTANESPRITSAEAGNRSSVPGARPSRSFSALVTVRGPRRPRAIPRSFLGISTEYWTLPIWDRHPALLKRVLGLLTVDAPLVLRIGGDSADRSLWSPVSELPEWAYELTPGWLSKVRHVVAITGSRVILNLNYVTATPTIAARWARAAEANLPRGSIVGFEIGNEPDIYSHRDWLQATAAGLRGTGLRALPHRMTPSDYAADFPQYSHALRRVAPGASLLGPALAEPGINARWVSVLLARAHPGLSAITVHRYPYSACVAPSSPKYPTIARVLSSSATIGMARSLRQVVRIAARAGLPVRVTELNSVTCGGTAGVSNTFATALWAPDALFSLVRAGVIGADVHVRADAINRAFALTDRGLVARPLLYGLLTFVRTIGPDSKLLSLDLRARPRLHLKAWAVLVRGNILHVLLIDKGRRSAGIALALPATAPLSMERLLAPSVRSTAGVTLGGQRLAPDGRWVGRRQTTLVAPRGGLYTVSVRRYSAALITVRLAR